MAAKHNVREPLSGGRRATLPRIRMRFRRIRRRNRFFGRRYYYPNHGKTFTNETVFRFLTTTRSPLTRRLMRDYGWEGGDFYETSSLYGWVRQHIPGRRRRHLRKRRRYLRAYNRAILARDLRIGNRQHLYDRMVNASRIFTVRRLAPIAFSQVQDHQQLTLGSSALIQAPNPVPLTFRFATPRAFRDLAQPNSALQPLYL